MSSESRVGRLTRRDFLKMGGGALAGAYAMGGLAGCGGGGSSGGAVELTLWAWLPDFQTQVDMFEKAHKNIKVKLVPSGRIIWLRSRPSRTAPSRSIARCERSLRWSVLNWTRMQPRVSKA